MHALHLFFGWPDGAVWGNLVAEFVVGLPVWLIAMYRFEKRHKRHQKANADALHNQISQEFANLSDRKNS